MNTILNISSKAIIGYLVGKYGKNDTLYPLDPQKRAIIDRMFYFDMDLHQKFRNWAVSVLETALIYFIGMVSFNVDTKTWTDPSFSLVSFSAASDEGR